MIANQIYVYRNMLRFVTIRDGTLGKHTQCYKSLIHNNETFGESIAKDIQGNGDK
jgi:hypothetical protein